MANGTPQPVLLLPNVITAGSVVLASLTVDAKGRVTAASSAATTGSGSVVLATSPTIVTPTIADLTNATHTHQNAAGGGSLDAAAIGSGTLNNARVNWASPSAIGGTAAAAGTFTVLNGTTSTATPILAPSADGTAALQFTKADASTVIGQIDTTNIRFGLGNNGSAPAQLLDLYDGHLRFTQLASAGAATAALAGLGAGNVNTGTHSYKVTFVTAAGETQAGTVSNTITTSAGNGQVALSAIPTGAAGTTSRKIYRTQAGGSVYNLLTTLNDNTTTTFADNVADATIVGAAVAPTSNSTGGNIYVGTTKALALDQSGNIFASSITVTQNGTFPITALLLTGSGTDLTLGMKNTAASGHNWNLLSSSNGTFRLYDDTAGANRISITAAGVFSFASTGSLTWVGPTTGTVASFSSTGAGSNADFRMFNDVQTWGFRVAGGLSNAFQIANFQNVTFPVTISAADGTSAFLATDTATAAVTNVLTLTHALTTANAGANNIGTGLLFQAADSTSAIGAGVTVAAINATLPNATHASRTGRIDITVTDNAATRTVISAGANGSAGILGFYGTSPIAQAVLATGASHTVDDVITALQNLGLVKQS